SKDQHQFFSNSNLWQSSYPVNQGTQRLQRSTLPHNYPPLPSIYTSQAVQLPNMAIEEPKAFRKPMDYCANSFLGYHQTVSTPTRQYHPVGPCFIEKPPSDPRTNPAFFPGSTWSLAGPIPQMDQSVPGEMTSYPIVGGPYMGNSMSPGE